MPFRLPRYHPPDFSAPPLDTAPVVDFARVRQPGVAPNGFHATSIFPEYYQTHKGEWQLLRQSRMDCPVVLTEGGRLEVRSFRRLDRGDRVAMGRRENGEDGIYVHTAGFDHAGHPDEKFAFRTQSSRESSFSLDYDRLYDLLAFEREHGFVLWVLGPAVAFDRDSRRAFVELLEEGYVHGLLAGNALAVHDLEGSLFGTGLGQDIYTKEIAPLGHYHHLETINRVRALGSIRKAVETGLVSEGIMSTVIHREIPFVLAGSIRDDGPLPEVTGDAYTAQDDMGVLARRATTVIALATQLHAIATGNMTPSYAVSPEGAVRPVYFYMVDMSEFAVSKLSNRGSLTARAILTNVQDFVVHVARGLKRRPG